MAIRRPPTTFSDSITGADLASETILQSVLQAKHYFEWNE